jgi:hypothetical protein
MKTIMCFDSSTRKGRGAWIRAGQAVAVVTYTVRTGGVGRGFCSGERAKSYFAFRSTLNVDAEHSEYERLIGWFDERPSEEFFACSIEHLRELLENIPVKQAVRLRMLLQFGCVEVAQAAGDIGLLRGGSNIRREEREQLQHIGERLGLSHSYV